MRVLIIPEDFRKDQYILKPLIEAMLHWLDVSRPRIQVCRDPLIGGISKALNEALIRQILERYQGMVDLFLLLVDRDGIAGRAQRLRQLENATLSLLNKNILIGENAWQEIEVWALAGLSLPTEWQWKTIRMEVNPKELYFEVLAQRRRVSKGPGGGRKALGEEAARNYSRIRQLCTEDIQNLEQNIENFITYR